MVMLLAVEIVPKPCADGSCRQCTSTGNASEVTGRQVAIGYMAIDDGTAVVLQDVTAGYGSNGQGSPL